MSRRRIATAVVLACVTSVVLATRVVVHFEAMRAKLVDGTPITPSGLTAIVDVDPLKPSVKASPFALVARIENKSSNSQRMTVLIDGQTVCSSSVPGLATTRVDCAFDGPWSPEAPHRIEVVATESPWRLVYLEIGTHHGATRGHDLLVLPDAYNRRVGPPLAVVALFFLVMAGLLLLPMPPMWRVLTLGYRVALGAVSVLFVLILISPFVSSFLLVVSIGLFWKCLAVVAVPRLWQAAEWSRSQRARGWRIALVGCTAVTLVVVSYGPLMVRLLDEEFDGNFSGFLRMSSARFDLHPSLSTRHDVRSSLILTDDDGYDGQFAYYAVYDPFLREFRDAPAPYHQFIDEPQYRYGRIGFSLLTRLVAGNRWQRYPATMVWLIFGGLLACVAGLMSIASASSNSPIRSALIVLMPAFWHSVQVALPEPIVAAFLIGGYACYSRRRIFVAAALFAASLLMRETGAILVLCLIAAELKSGDRRSALILGGLTFAPLLLWRGFVSWVLAPALGAGDVWHSAGVLGLPFVGIVRLWTFIGQGQYFGGRGDFGLAGIWFPILLIAGLGIAAWLARRRTGPIAIAALLYGIVAVSMTYEKVWEHISNGQRGTFELFLMLAIVSAGDTSRLPRGLKVALATFWVATAGYVFYGAFDAPYIRDAITGALF